MDSSVEQLRVNNARLLLKLQQEQNSLRYLLDSVLQLSPDSYKEEAAPRRTGSSRSRRRLFAGNDPQDQPARSPLRTAANQPPVETPQTVRRGRALIEKHLKDKENGRSAKVVKFRTGRRSSSKSRTEVVESSFVTEDFLNELRQFRDRHQNDCLSSQSGEAVDEVAPTPQRKPTEQKTSLKAKSRRTSTERRNTTRSFDPLHRCIHSYGINDRLFAYPLHADEEGRSLCPMCDRPRTDDQPAYLRVTLPKTATFSGVGDGRWAKKRGPAVADRTDKGDSLALRNNCASGYITHWPTTDQHRLEQLKHTNASLALSEHVTRPMDLCGTQSKNRPASAPSSHGPRFKHSKYFNEDQLKQKASLAGRMADERFRTKREEFLSHLGEISRKIELQLARDAMLEGRSAVPSGCTSSKALVDLRRRCRKLSTQLRKTVAEREMSGAAVVFAAESEQQKKKKEKHDSEDEPRSPIEPATSASFVNRSTSAATTTTTTTTSGNNSALPAVRTSKVSSIPSTPIRKSVSFASEQNSTRTSSAFVEKPPLGSRALTDHLLTTSCALRLEMDRIKARRHGPSPHIGHR